MESTVRIYIGAVIVVNLLLLNSTKATTANETTNDGEIITNRNIRVNTASWVLNKEKSNVDSNELNYRNQVSEDHSEQNAKYKDRGRVRFTSQSKKSTAAPRRKPTEPVSSETESKVMIVTPTPPKKNITQIMDSMRTYKKSVSSTTPLTVDFSDSDEDDEYSDNESESYSSSTEEPQSLERFKNINYPKPTKNKEYTTPKNDFFDKRYREISSNMKKRIGLNKTSTQNLIKQPFKARFNLTHENLKKPSNKTSIYIKRTKEVRTDDSEGALSENHETVSPRSTSVYVKSSVISTDTVTFDNTDEDDCDDNTSSESSSASVDDDAQTSEQTTTETIELTTNVPELKTTKGPVSATTRTSKKIEENFVKPKENSTASVNTTNRNNFSKRLNFTSKDTIRHDQAASNQILRPNRRFYSTTPKNKVWMAPRRNTTRTYARPTPAAVYIEHFDINDRMTTPRPRMPERLPYTTTSAEIDPVQQSEVVAAKRVIHSNSATDNTIPTVMKRGSTRFSTSTAATETGVSDLEIPPTLTAWALASLRSPPSLASIANTTKPQKNDDENELQKVSSEYLENNVPILTTQGTTTSDLPPKFNISDINQNNLTWKPSFSKSEASHTPADAKPAESNISIQNTVQTTTETLDYNLPEIITPLLKPSNQATSWINIKNGPDVVLQENLSENDIPSTNSTKSGFQSITKFPSTVTTPEGEESKLGYEKADTTEYNTEVPTTTDYEITTIRFTYVPTLTEEYIQINETATESSWVPMIPAKEITTESTPITTYRPKYDTDPSEDTTSIPASTPESIELSSINVKSLTEIEQTDKESIMETTTVLPSDVPTTNVIEVTSTFTSTTEAPTTTTSTTTTTTTEAPTTSSSTTTIAPTTVTVPTTEAIETTTELATTKDDETETMNATELTEDQDQEELTTVQEPKTSEETTEPTTKYVTEDPGRFGDFTTEQTRMGPDESVGAGVAIAVSTIGVIALILLVGLLLVVRRRGQRGAYAQRCTPVSLDAYSLDSVSVGPRKGNQRNRIRSSKRSYGNPAFDDEVTSHPMQYAALANFALDSESMSSEFNEIPSISVRPDEVPPGCEDKNRYSNVLPLPETRVPLTRIGSDLASEYINANYITGPGNIKNYYIACQAPLQNTVNDVWRMIWEQNTRLIVMLTEYMENGVEKCYEYLPPSEVSDNKRVFGDFQIILKKREQKDKYAISTVQLFNTKTRTCREITHLWYFWPAKGVPDDFDSILEFLSEMRTTMKTAQSAKEFGEDGVELLYNEQGRNSFHNGRRNEKNGYSPQPQEQMRRNGSNGTIGRGKPESDVRPCVVLCASGAGRSCTVIALDICTRALAAGRVDVPRVVRELRAQRSHAIANRQHYIFLYKVLSEYGNKLMGGGTDAI